jgi:hypothetical protein
MQWEDEKQKKSKESKKWTEFKRKKLKEKRENLWWHAARNVKSGRAACSEKTRKTEQRCKDEPPCGAESKCGVSRRRRTYVRRKFSINFRADVKWRFWIWRWVVNADTLRFVRTFLDDKSWETLRTFQCRLFSHERR